MSIAGGRDQATSVSRESPGGIPQPGRPWGLCSSWGAQPEEAGPLSGSSGQPGCCCCPCAGPGDRGAAGPSSPPSYAAAPGPAGSQGPPGSRSRLQSSPAAGRKQGRHTTMSLTHHGPRLRRALCARSLHSQVSDFQPTPPG